MNPATTQAQKQGYMVAHLSTHLIYEIICEELQEHVKGPNLQIQNYRISTTQYNNRMDIQEASQ